jgi:hypothetical protein
LRSSFLRYRPGTACVLYRYRVANPWIFCPQTQFEVARLPQKWEYPWVRCEGVISKYMRKRALEK